VGLIPAPSTRRDTIQSYGGGSFRVGGRQWPGAVLVLPQQTLAGPATDFAALTPADFAPVLAAAG